MAKRMLKPLVLETKEQLLSALKAGKLTCSKYNLLKEEEKLFVEMIVFGDYTAEQAMHAIRPLVKDCRAAANRMLANKDVADTLEELSVQKDAKFMAELGAARDMALNKLKYIMNTTCDEAVAAACAKTILDKAEKIILDTSKNNKDEVTDVKFAIRVDNMVVNPREEAKKTPIDGTIEVEIEPDDKEESVDTPTIGDNGLPYTISYANIDNYNDSNN